MVSGLLIAEIRSELFLYGIREKRKRRFMKDKKKKITTAELDAKFDRGENITEHMDLSHAVKRVNVDFPAWSIGELDKEAHAGVLHDLYEMNPASTS